MCLFVVLAAQAAQEENLVCVLTMIIPVEPDGCQL